MSEKNSPRTRHDWLIDLLAALAGIGTCCLDVAIDDLLFTALAVAVGGHRSNIQFNGTCRLFNSNGEADARPDVGIASRGVARDCRSLRRGGGAVLFWSIRVFEFNG